MYEIVVEDRKEATYWVVKKNRNEVKRFGSKQEAIEYVKEVESANNSKKTYNNNKKEK